MRQHRHKLARTNTYYETMTYWRLEPVYGIPTSYLLWNHDTLEAWTGVWHTNIVLTLQPSFEEHNFIHSVSHCILNIHAFRRSSSLNLFTIIFVLFLILVFSILFLWHFDIYTFFLIFIRYLSRWKTYIYTVVSYCIQLFTILLFLFCSFLTW